MTTEIKKICCYIKTNSQDPTLNERIEFLKSVVALHEDWECVGFVIDKSKRSGLDRPDLSEILKKWRTAKLNILLLPTFLFCIRTSVFCRSLLTSSKVLDVGSQVCTRE